MRMTTTVPLALVFGLFGGCARTGQVASPAHAAEPDCSFRAASSCWTLATRFPARRAEPTDSQPGKNLSPPRAVLASKADSARGPQ
jgi:hypothetical protein